MLLFESNGQGRDEAMQRIRKTFMPIWQPCGDGTAEQTIALLTDKEEQTIAWAAHHYFQGRYDMTSEESECCLQSACPEIRSSARLLHGMANVGLGHAEATQADFDALTQAARQPEDAQMAAIYDTLRFLLAVFFHTDGEIAPVQDESIVCLTEGTRLYLLYAVAHAMYLQKRHVEALGVAKAALMMAAGRYPSVEVYLNLVASMVASNLHDGTQAAEFFHKA